METKRALVLGGGGVVGIAWETGVLVGMAEAGIDIRAADLFLGTSAGSTVAAQMTSELPLETLFQRQIDPTLQSTEIPVVINFQQLATDFHTIIQKGGSITEKLQRIGALAQTTPTVTEEERLAVIASRLPIHNWSSQQLAIITVNADSGERIVFTHKSGVDLVAAVAASCAIPCVWPPVTINGHSYIDGGSYSAANADLADGFQRVLIIQPDTPPFTLESLDEQVKLLRKNGARVEVITPDEAFKSVLAAVGGNLLDPSAREGAAHAGRAQGHVIAPLLTSLWE